MILMTEGFQSPALELTKREERHLGSKVYERRAGSNSQFGGLSFAIFQISQVGREANPHARASAITIALDSSI